MEKFNYHLLSGAKQRISHIFSAKIFKSETGQVLPMALILLVLGGLLVVPTLNFMSTNLNANRQIDTVNSELYAADAGVEEIVWNIENNIHDEVDNPDGIVLPGVSDPPLPFALDLNGKAVNAELSRVAGSLYKITSTATSPDGHDTTVECYIRLQADYSFFFDEAITTASSARISPNSVVNGDVVYAGDEPDIQGTVNDIDNDGETVTQQTDLPDRWPTADELKEVYSAQVEDAPTVPAGYEINLSGYTQASPRSIWNGAPGEPPDPLLAEGALNIKGSGWARLDGTVYIKGDLTVWPSCTIDLSGQTIFAEGDITLQPGCAIVGSGCIIAVGDINFSPNIGAAATDKLIGVDDDQVGTDSQSTNKLILARFQAVQTGKMEIFRMQCSAKNANIKLAVYADSGGGNPVPTEPMSIATLGEPQSVIVADWNNFSFWRNEAPQLEAGNYYWLAANADSNIIEYKTPTTATSNIKTAVFANPLPTPPISDLTKETDKQYCFAGYRAPFVFLLSVSGTSTVQPNGTLYGTVAGGNTDIQTTVEMQGKTVLTLSNTPEDGLNFPGWNGGGEDIEGIPVTIRTYTIK
jgi:hypothetical protein